MSKKIKINFAPSFFEQFTGSQEELDKLMEDIVSLAESGKLFEENDSILLEELSDEEQENLFYDYAKKPTFH